MSGFETSSPNENICELCRAIREYKQCQWNRPYVVKDRKDDTLGYSHSPRVLYSHGEFLGSAMLNVHNVKEGGPTAFDVETVLTSCIKV